MQTQSKATTPTPTEKKTPGLFNVSDATTFTAQIAQLTHYVKKLATKDVAQEEEDTTLDPTSGAPTTANYVHCVYCEGGHEYEECHGNPILVNYVRSQPNMAYNAYSNMYNPGWTDDPLISHGVVNRRMHKQQS